MKKDAFAGRIAAVLRDKQAKKYVKPQKATFRISDEEGHYKDFTVASASTSVPYTVDDVRIMLDTAIQVLEELLCRGDELNLRGIGNLGLKYRETRKTKIPGTDQWVTIDGHYVPKFTPGHLLKTCARIYEVSLGDRDNIELPLPPPVDDEWEEEVEDGDEDERNVD